MCKYREFRILAETHGYIRTSVYVSMCTTLLATGKPDTALLKFGGRQKMSRSLSVVRLTPVPSGIHAKRAGSRCNPALRFGNRALLTALLVVCFGDGSSALRDSGLAIGYKFLDAHDSTSSLDQQCLRALKVVARFSQGSFVCSHSRSVLSRLLISCTLQVRYPSSLRWAYALCPSG